MDRVGDRAGGTVRVRARNARVRVRACGAIEKAGNRDKSSRATEKSDRQGCKSVSGKSEHQFVSSIDGTAINEMLCPDRLRWVGTVDL